MFTNCTYTEPGYFVTDDRTPVDQIIMVYDTSSINSGIPGDYYVRYMATDSDGNTAYAQRKVVVEPFSLNYFQRTFLAHDTLKPLNVITRYPVQCQVFSSELRWVKIRNFNNLGLNFELIMNVDSAGNITVNYNVNQIKIMGTGTTYCDMSGFRLEYHIETPQTGIEVHFVTYQP